MRSSTSRENLGNEVTTTDIEREKEILTKQKEVIKRQAEEMREEFQSMKHEYERTVKREYGIPETVECYKIKDFMELVEDGTPKLLHEAIKYYESHDGCPFYKDKCNISKNPECKGIWVKMGSPCFQLVKNVKKYLKTFKDIEKC